MIESFMPQNEQLPYPEDVIESFNHLLLQGDFTTSSYPFIQELQKVKLDDDIKKQLGSAKRSINRQHRNSGIGYLSPSSKHNKSKELLATAFVANCFLEREISTKPIIVSVDDFYKFVPFNLSLVGKTLIFNEIAKSKKPDENFALVLTNFTRSNIFTQEILEQIPVQDNAGLDITNTTHFGKSLMDFALNNLPVLVEKEKGYLNAVLQKIIQSGNFSEQNSKLLLVTGLLLQDCQTWQSLWYEKVKKGTPLYIVASTSFHDAMNRLNLTWGHGGADYRDRASNSLGNIDESPLEDKVILNNYYKQGLSTEEFADKITPILNQLKK